MYAISYSMPTGYAQHSATSAAAAVETLEMLEEAGGMLLKIVVTLSGSEISVAELRQFASDET